MKAKDFLEHLKWKPGMASSVDEAFFELFGPGFDKYKFSPGEKMKLITMSYAKIQYDRDVALAAVRRLSKESDGLRQTCFVYRQEKSEIKNPETL